MMSMLAFAACGPKGAPALDMANLDPSVSPKEDFYQYSTGGWQKNNPLRPEFSRYGSFDALREQAQENLNALFQSMTELETVPGSVEQKISENRWDEVEYSKLPSGAGLKYRQAFWKHDGERYGAFIENVSKGEEKINSGTLMPYDLVRKECDQNGHDAVIEELWKALPDWTNDSSSLVVADVSGSMYGTYCRGSMANVSSKPAPIFVSTSLAMYFAEKAKGPFKDCVITFSQHPECLKLNSEDSLYERFMEMERHGGLNTNIERMFKLYISLAQDSKPEDCPKNLVIISDMEFDEIENPEEWWYSNTREEAKKKLDARKKTLFSKIDLLFKNTNVERPTLVFWNVNSRQANVPVSRDEYGTILVSGFSPTIFQYIVGGDINPMKFMLKTLSNYDCILERAGIEKA